MDEFTKQFDLAGNCAKLVLKENVLAVLSDADLTTVSTAIYNGGFKKVKAILNVEVPEGYSDRLLHADPLKLITDSSKKLGVTDNFVAMITAAKIKNVSIVSKKEDNLAVSVAATAGCSHAESPGEDMNVQEIVGTINIIVIIDGNPTESCLVSVLPMTTEAKTAALKDLDIRSRYSGDAATGTITDSIVAAATGKGPEIGYGGPASKLGKMVGYCTRKAVKEALMKQEGWSACRSILDRLKERHLPLEKLASELSKIDGFNADINALGTTLAKVIKNKPLFASFLMAAAKIDDDIKKELVPSEFRNIGGLSKDFGRLIANQNSDNTKTRVADNKEEYTSVDLPPFLKQALINILRRSADSKERNGKLK